MWALMRCHTTARRQHWLSTVKVQHVTECLSHKMPPSVILSKNLLRIELKWLRVHSSAATDGAL